MAHSQAFEPEGFGRGAAQVRLTTGSVPLEPRPPLEADPRLATRPAIRTRTDSPVTNLLRNSDSFPSEASLDSR